MKIAHVFSNYKIGGAQTLLIDIMNYQCKNNIVYLFIITNIYEQTLLEKLDKRIRIINLNRKIGSINYWPYLKLNLMLNFCKFDIVHTHENHVGEKLFLHNKIGRFHTIHTTGLYALNYKFIKLDGIFTISETVYNVAYTFLKSNKNLILANNGINPELISVRKQDKLNSPHILIGCVSRLIHETKGQDLIIEAIHILKQQKKLPIELKVEFIGEGPSLDYLKGLTKQYQLENNISFAGAKDRSHIYKHLKDYDLFIQPSRFEGFALTVIEALAANVPVLVSNFQGPYEIICEGKFGNYFENNNAEDLANKIYDSIKNYKDLVLKTYAGHEMVLKKYNIKRTADIYLNNYRKYINKH